jgi:hypothetical protein
LVVAPSRNTRKPAGSIPHIMRSTAHLRFVAIFARILAAANTGEAEDALDLLFAMERAWFAARATVAGRRRTSHAASAVDLLAAAPLVSATTLAAGLGMAVKNAAALLDDFRRNGITIEVTHRSKRRLFGLAELAPLRAVVRPPARPDANRERGRPRLDRPDEPADSLVLALPPAPLTPIERRAFDYGALDDAMAYLDQTTVARGAPCTRWRTDSTHPWHRPPTRTEGPTPTTLSRPPWCDHARLGLTLGGSAHGSA